MGQEVILTFMSYLRNTFFKPIAVTGNDSSDESRSSTLNIFSKEFTVSVAIKNIHDSWEEVKISTLTGVQKKFDSNVHV